MVSFDNVLDLNLKVGKIISAESIEGSEKLVKLSVDLGLKKQEPVLSEGAPEKVATEANGESTDVVPEAAATEPVVAARDIRQIIAGIKKFYSPEELVGKEIVVVANLAPRKLMGMVSEGMLLAASEGDVLTLVTPEKEIAAGAEVH
jgi:tRNA-binding EMAP/Myf-like protein